MDLGFWGFRAETSFWEEVGSKILGGETMRSLSVLFWTIFGLRDWLGMGRETWEETRGLHAEGGRCLEALCGGRSTAHATVSSVDVFRGTKKVFCSTCCKQTRAKKPGDRCCSFSLHFVSLDSPLMEKGIGWRVELERFGGASLEEHAWQDCLEETLEDLQSAI